MPIEKHPIKTLPKGYVPQGGIPYRVKTGDDWESVARRHAVTVDRLIRFNFETREPSEVNWYLRRNVGCVFPSRDGYNWVFTSRAKPGIIYVPPEWHRPSFPKEWHRPSFPPEPIPKVLAPKGHEKPSGIWFGFGGTEGGMLGPVGKETVEGILFSYERYDRQFWMNIDGWRLGFGLGASIGVVLIIVTGAESPFDIQGLGIDGDTDFQLSLEEKWGDIGKAAKGLKALKKVATAGKYVDKAVSFAEWEGIRDLIWNILKAKDIDTKKLAVNVIGVPWAGKGLEASAYKSAGSVFVHDVSDPLHI